MLPWHGRCTRRILNRNPGRSAYLVEKEQFLLILETFPVENKIKLMYGATSSNELSAHHSTVKGTASETDANSTHVHVKRAC